MKIMRNMIGIMKYQTIYTENIEPFWNSQFGIAMSLKSKQWGFLLSASPYLLFPFGTSNYKTNILWKMRRKTSFSGPRNVIKVVYYIVNQNLLWFGENRLYIWISKWILRNLEWASLPNFCQKNVLQTIEAKFLIINATSVVIL